MTADQNALFDVLTRFAGSLAHSFAVTDVLSNLTDSTITVLGATTAGVALADGTTLDFVSADSEIALALEKIQQDSLQGPCHQAFTTGETVLVSNIDAHDEWPVYRQAANSVGLRAMMGVPLIVGDNCLGALNVYHDEERVWAEAEVRVAEVLANMTTSYLLHVSRLDEASRVNEQLQNALDSRIVIEQAKGILAGERGVGLDVAFESLRIHARQNQATLRSVADAVVHTGFRPRP